MTDETRQNPIPEGCPEPEAVAAYLDGRLAGAEKGKMEAHRASCEDCYAVFSESARAEAEARGEGSAAPVARPRFGRGWIALAAAAVLVAAAVPLALRVRARRNVRPDVSELVAAVGAERPFEPRVTGGFQFGPMKPVYRGSGTANEQSLELLAAAGRIRKKAEEHPSPQSLRAAGAAELALGEWDRAVDALSQASRLAPKDSGIESDLAAAYMARAKNLDRSEDYARAVETAEHAVELPNPPPEALFNRALALEMMNLKPEAATAWGRYLKVDPKSGWAEEARRHLGRLREGKTSLNWNEVQPRLVAGNLSAAIEGPLVSRFPEQSRTLAEDQLLPEWGRASLQSDASTARSSLDTAREIGVRLAAQTGERLLRDSVEEIDRASAIKRRELAESYRDFGDAREHYSMQDFASALDRFETSAKEFGGAASPFRIRALEGRASCLYISRRVTEALEALCQVGPVEILEKKGYRSAAGELGWVTGLLNQTLGAGHSEDSIRSYSQALADFEADNELENSSAVHRLLCGAFGDLGDTPHEWEHYRASLASLDEITNPYRAYQVLSVATLTAVNEHFDRLARLTSEHLIAQAARLRNSFELSEAYWLKSRILLSLGRQDEALRTFRAAESEAEGDADRESRERTLAIVKIARAPVLASSEPGRALREIEQATRFLKAREDRSNYVVGLLARGRVEEMVGTRSAAEKDLTSAVNELDAQRAEIADESHAISFFDTAREVVDEEVALLEKDGRDGDAFSLLEQVRARALLDRRRPTPTGEAGASVQPSAVSAVLPQGSALIEFALLPDRLLEWGITSRSVSFTSRPFARANAEAIVSGIRPREGGVRRMYSAGALKELSRQLLDGLSREVLEARDLVIVPDGCLNLVPFGALIDPVGGGPLIDRHSITIAPSARFVALAKAHRTRPAPGPNPALVIGEPAFDRTRFPGLPELPAARAEAAQVAALYPGARVLTGSDATITRFAELACSSKLIHFAGHTIPNPQRLDEPALLLAPEPGGPDFGVLTATQIGRMSMESRPLVVLSACETGGGEVRSSEGVISLARAFLEAGATGVVASLWSVDDKSAAAILVPFHRLLLEGVPPAEALAQMVRRVRNRSGSGEGSAFEFFGGDSASRSGLVNLNIPATLPHKLTVDSPLAASRRRHRSSAG